MSQIRQAIECSEDQYAGTHFPVQNKKHMKWFSCAKLMPDWKILIKKSWSKILDQKILIKKNLHCKITTEIMIENLHLDSFKKLIFTHWEILILIGLNCLDHKLIPHDHIQYPTIYTLNPIQNRF
jgi:hypothetical protein